MSNSYTSNFEPNPLERVAAVGAPLALVAALVCIVGVEFALWGNRDVYADKAACSGKRKANLLNAAS